MDTKEKKHPVHSILNKFYSPSKRNRKRLNNPITGEIEKDGMKILCIPEGLQYEKEYFNIEKERNLKDFLKKRFEFFKGTINKYVEGLKF